MLLETVLHTLDPVYNEHSRVLILGTMPSPQSRQAGFYYMHPQNRFWRVLSSVLGRVIPADPDGRRAFLLHYHIALWDVLARCDISGASDASIKNPVPNDLHRILSAAPVRTVFTTGVSAAQLYRRYCFPACGIAAVALPSTSPANCACSFEKLVSSYRVLADILAEDGL